MSDSQTEIWKAINERYEVSSHGRIRSLPVSGIDKRGRPTFKRGVLFKTVLGAHGYPVANITGFGHKKHWKVHRLVAIHFLPNPDNLPVINHKNGIRHDNRVENLEWCTQRDNCQHAYDVLNRPPSKAIGERNAVSKKVVDSNGFAYQSLNEAAKKYGIKSTTLGAMLRGENPNKTDLKYA